MKRWMLLSGLMVLLMLVFLVPQVSAQAGEANIRDCSTENVNDFLTPFAGQMVVDVSCSVEFNNDATEQSPVSSIEVSINPTVEQGGSAVTVTPSTTSVFVSVPPAGSNPQEGKTQPLNFKLFLSANDDLSAFSTVKVDAGISGSGPTAKTYEVGAESVKFQFKIDYYSTTSFSGQTIVKGSPSETAVIPVTVINQGNGKTTYQISVEKSRSEWSMTYTPPKLVIEPSQTVQKQNRGDVTMSVLSDQGTQYSNDIGQFTLQTEARPTIVPSTFDAGDPPTTSTNIAVHLQGMIIPGFHGPAALAGLAAVALVLRRRFDAD